MFYKKVIKACIGLIFMMSIIFGTSIEGADAATNLRKPTISQQAEYIKSLYPYSAQEWDLQKSTQADRYMRLADMQYDSLIPLKPVRVTYSEKEKFLYLPYSSKNLDNWTQRLFNFKTTMNKVRLKDDLLVSYKTPNYRYLISPERGGGIYKLSHQVSHFKKISAKRVYVQYQSYIYSAIDSKDPHMKIDFLKQPRSKWSEIQKSETKLYEKGYAILESSGDDDYPWRVILTSLEDSSLSDKEINKYK